MVERGGHGGDFSSGGDGMKQFVPLLVALVTVAKFGSEVGDKARAEGGVGKIDVQGEISLEVV
jgi:hypothetical protein